MAGAFLIFLAAELGLLGHFGHQVAHEVLEAGGGASGEMGLVEILAGRAGGAVLLRLSGGGGRPAGMTGGRVGFSIPRRLLLFSGNQLVQATGGRRRAGHPSRLVGSPAAQRFPSLTRQPHGRQVREGHRLGCRQLRLAGWLLERFGHRGRLR